jgi:soluble lytic murein transglycosylase
MVCAAALAFAIAAVPAFAQTRSSKPAGKKPAASAKKPAASEPADSTERLEKQLSELTHQLEGPGAAPAASAVKLEAFARAHAADEYGSRAALALGHYELGKAHAPQAVTWFEAALKHPGVLEEYAVFWHAQALRQAGHNDLALTELENFRTKFAESVMADVALQSYAEAAIATGNPARAVTALNSYAKISQKASLLLLRAQAHEKAGEPQPAAADYLLIYYGSPLADEARIASSRIAALSRQLGESFPATTVAEQTSRAESLYDARRWREGAAEFDALIPQAGSPAESQHAQLRVIECRAADGASASALANASFSDPDAEAERIYALSQEYRSEKREPEMLSAINSVVAKFPQNHWSEEALFAAGNYYLVLLDRDRAAGYYRQIAQNFGGEKNAPIAEWRAIWTDYLNRKQEAPAELEAYIQKYPTSPNLPDALYFLGRAAERANDSGRARSFFIKASQRFPQTYFGMHSAERLKAIGNEPIEPVAVLSAIPDPPPLVALADPVPTNLTDRWQRALALRTVAFDSSAELELRAAFSVSPSPRVILEAADAAIDAQHFAAGISLARLAFPQPEARQPSEMPDPVVRALYPVPYLPLVDRASTRNKVDPMLVEGIMRQESAFIPEAVSTAGAVGLMQVLPKTAPHLARRLKLRYSRARLFDPEFNLNVGTLYVNDLLTQFGSPEAALAAYNAGEDRVEAWQAERQYSELPEFVESIPFSQTRDYVQIVMRNAAMYRLVGATSVNVAAADTHPRSYVPPPTPKPRPSRRSASRGL